jgi:uncharacterized protein (TIGR00255 family)
MVNSMTGFATLTGRVGDTSWALEVKSVNARGLDLRMRLADGADILEPLFKTALGKITKRGAVNVFLRVDTRVSETTPRLNIDSMNAAISAIAAIEEAAKEQGQALAPTDAASILLLRGVFDTGPILADSGALVAAVKAAIPQITHAFADSRAAEGTALTAVLANQIEQVAKLTVDAKQAARERQELVAQRLRENMKIIMSTVDDLDAPRLEQELALLAVKADITEEIDRLSAHAQAARDLLASKGAIGRKFDFLMQEFNREANTLCSKSGSTELTRIGLDLKTVIDQMREQVQNVE